MKKRVDMLEVECNHLRRIVKEKAEIEGRKFTATVGLLQDLQLVQESAKAGNTTHVCEMLTGCERIVRDDLLT